MTKELDDFQKLSQHLQRIETVVNNLGQGFKDLWGNTTVVAHEIQSIMNVIVDKGLISEIDLKKVRAKTLASKRKNQPANIMELASVYIQPNTDKEYVDLIALEFGIDVEKMHEKAKQLGEENANSGS